MRIAVLDIETTGRYPQQGTIVEIGIIMVDLDTEYMSPLLDTTCRDPLFTSKFEGNRLEECWVFQNSSLRVQDVQNGPTWEEVGPKIQRILAKFPVTAYNTQFDFGFLKAAGIDITHELPCPMIAATPVLKLPPTRIDMDYKWPSVQECWNYFFPQESDYLETHRAFDDTIHEAKIVLELYKRQAWMPKILKKYK